MRPWSHRALALALFGVGCGDPLVDGSYPGQPLLEASGGVQIRQVQEVGMADGRLRVALFWVRPEGWEDLDPDLGVLDIPEQAVAISDLPGVYGFRVYDPAPPEVMMDASTLGGTGAFALAALLVYVDAADNHAFDRGDDWIVGSVEQQIYAFTREGAEVPAYGTLEPGYTPLDAVKENVGYSCTNDSIDLSIGEVGRPLVIEFLYDVLVDPNCDRQATEFAICPAPAYIEALCQENPGHERCIPFEHCG